jgi:hypothetical protein
MGAGGSREAWRNTRANRNVSTTWNRLNGRYDTHPWDDPSSHDKPSTPEQLEQEREILHKRETERREREVQAALEQERLSPRFFCRSSNQSRGPPWDEGRKRILWMCATILAAPKLSDLKDRESAALRTEVT